MKKNDSKNKLSVQLQPWDISYYNNQILKTKFNVDHEKIREYLIRISKENVSQKQANEIYAMISITSDMEIPQY